MERGKVGIQNIVRYLLLVLAALGFLAVSTVARAQESALPLVHVYCAEVSRLAKDGETVSDDAWAALVTRLERREQRASAVGQGDAMEECLRENAAAFERAEFVLHGAKLLEDSLKDFTPSQTAASTKPETASLGVPGLESLVIPSVDPSPTATDEWRREAEERRRHYSELWQDFLSDLRRKLSAEASLSRVTANLKR